jgi:hypothetical protein
MPDSVTTTPFRSTRDGSPSWELAYRLEEADHLAHWRWALSPVPGNTAPPAPVSGAIGSCFVLFFIFSALPVFVAILFALGRVSLDVVVWTCLVSWVLAVAAWVNGVLGGPAAQALQKDDEARQAVAVRLATGGIRLGREDRVSFGAADVLEITELRRSEPGFDLLERKETRFSWALIANIAELEGLLVFIVADKGNLLVPRRCFPDEATYQDFLAFVHERLAPPREEGITTQPAV